ncbi:MAG: hypothetical protein AAGA87_03815 [Pseudomonadota bacterium]
MPDANMQNFDQRLDRILRKQSRIAKGYKPKMTKDGLIIAQPRSRFRFPWRALLFILIVGFAAKVAFLTALGAEAYDSQVASLISGLPGEQYAAWVLKADPWTVAASEQLAALREN